MGFQCIKESGVPPKTLISPNGKSQRLAKWKGKFLAGKLFSGSFFFFFPPMTSQTSSNSSPSLHVLMKAALNNAHKLITVETEPQNVQQKKMKGEQTQHSATKLQGKTSQCDVTAVINRLRLNSALQL